MIPLLFLEQVFLTANFLKVFEGGWVPLLLAACIGLIMVTWVRGSRLLVKQTRKNEADLEWLLRKLEAKPPHRVPGTAVFFTGDVVLFRKLLLACLVIGNPLAIAHAVFKASLGLQRTIGSIDLPTAVRLSLLESRLAI